MMSTGQLEFARHVLAAVADHLWQSTLYLVCVLLVSVALNKQQAKTRYTIWLSATAKFLIPFSAFRLLGAWLANFNEALPQQAGVEMVVRYVGRPFAPADSIASRGTPGPLASLPAIVCLVWLIGSVVVLLRDWNRWKIVRAAKKAATPVHEGREVDALRNAERSAVVLQPIPLLLSECTLEPGVVGILRPALMWPVGITKNLDDNHLEAIMLHEAWHVRRRDNLTSLFQMLVEVVFWFHPLVWWLGARLISERERSCDEAVLQCGSDPRVYAESILKASEFCVGSSLACVSGVTGSDLKQRVVRIMTHKGKLNLSLGGKLLLSTFGIAVITAPVLAGVFSNRPVFAAAARPTAADNPAPLETATIRPSHSAETMNLGLRFHNGDLTYTNVTVKQMILYAFDLKDYQLTNAPAWTSTERYDVAATWQPSKKVIAPDVAAPQPPPPPAGSMVKRPLEPMVPLEHGQLELILKSVLATRFGLQVTSEPKNLPGFAMEVVAGGTKLPKAIAPSLADDGEQILTVREYSKNGVHELGTAGPLRNFTDQISEKVGAPVADKTGLQGTYDVTLKWTSGEKDPEAIRTALEQQLGLDLAPVSTPVQMLNVEQVKPPSLD